MRHVSFDYVAPNQIEVGDIIMCYKHDDQLERRAARVVAIEFDDRPDTYRWRNDEGKVILERFYEYRLWLTCRHVNIKHLDAAGGPEYRWHRFPWNGVGRYRL